MNHAPAPRPVSIVPPPDRPPTPAAAGPCPPAGVLWVALAEMGVQQALSKYGSRSLRKHGRTVRSRDNHLKDLDPALWYMNLPPLPSAVVDELLLGTLAYFDQSAAHADKDRAACIRAVLVVYLRTIIVGRIRHDRAKLAVALQQAGCVEVSAAA